MTDIVDRLRQWVGMTPEVAAVSQVPYGLFCEAADVIETLRKAERVCAIAIEQAVKAEQERCAEVARNRFPDSPMGDAIAKAIRKGTND